MRQLIFIIGAGLVAVSAHASQPTSQRYGEWSVGQFAAEAYTGEESDTGKMDIAVGISQSANCRADGGNCDDLGVSWTGGDSIEVSAHFRGCSSENGDFEPFYTVPLLLWKKTGQAMERHIEKDFKAWLGQATLMCDKPERAATFDFKQLRPAVRAFTRILTN